MNKSFLVLKREYVTRVRKKSFIIMTLLVPLMMAAFTVLPAYLASLGDTEMRTIAVYDPTGLILNKLEDQPYTKFHYIPEQQYNEISKNFKSSEFYALLFIPPNILTTSQAQLISDKQVTFDIKNMVSNRIESIIEGEKRQKVINEVGIPDLENRLASTKTRISLNTIKIGEKGQAVKSSTEMAMAIGYAAGLLIYFFVLMYGMMVMRGVMEEKTNRIVEVIISSVKPFQLLFGKIVGIGLVGLTQIALWIILGTAIITGITAFIGGDAASASMQSQNIMAGSQAVGNMAANSGKSNAVLELLNMAGNLNIALIIFCLIFYFITGFLLYASLFGALGSAVDSDEDAQQMMFPIMMPLILSIIMLFPVVKNPEGPLAFWVSIIPFTSPVTMMVRIPFGIPVWQIILSMSLMLATILGTIWMAGKIYRTGILMYGKKVNIKEIVKWLFYKN